MKVKNIRWIILLITIIPFMAFTCGDKVNGGHQYITFVNKSIDTIWVTDKWRIKVNIADTLYECSNFEIDLIPKDSFLFISLNNYWETDFNVIPYIQFFVFSKPTFDISCEEAQKYQLKRYQLTKEDLQRMNWTVIYPPEE